MKESRQKRERERREMERERDLGGGVEGIGGNFKNLSKLLKIAWKALS